MLFKVLSNYLEWALWIGLIVWGLGMVFYGIVGGAIGILRSLPAWLICLLVLLAFSRFV